MDIEPRGDPVSDKQQKGISMPLEKPSVWDNRDRLSLGSGHGGIDPCVDGNSKGAQSQSYSHEAIKR